MLSFTLTIGFVITHLFLFFPIKKIILMEKVDNDFVFIYISNLLLLMAFFYYFILANSLFFSFFIALFLMIFSYLFVYHIKNRLGKYQLFTLPYFFFCVFTFAKILMLCLF